MNPTFHGYSDGSGDFLCSTCHANVDPSYGDSVFTAYPPCTTGAIECAECCVHLMDCPQCEEAAEQGYRACDGCEDGYEIGVGGYRIDRLP